MKEKLAAVEEVRDHVEFVLGLKRVVHLHQERTLHVLQYLSLGPSVIDLVPLK